MTLRTMSDLPSKDPMVARLRKAAIGGADWLHDVADRIEQLQMPHAEVLKLAETDDGADTQAMLKALCKKIEAQRREIARLNRDMRAEAKASAVEERWKSSQGEDYGTY